MKVNGYLPFIRHAGKAAALHSKEKGPPNFAGPWSAQTDRVGFD
jgi:hypothetical protein